MTDGGPWPRNAGLGRSWDLGRGDPQLALSLFIVIGRVFSSLFSLACEPEPEPEPDSMQDGPQKRLRSLCPERLVLSIPESPGTPCRWPENIPPCPTHPNMVGGGLTQCLSPLCFWKTHPASTLSQGKGRKLRDQTWWQHNPAEAKPGWRMGGDRNPALSPSPLAM
ncbi:hypothetical protein FALBO_14380 [Fusarium albosuccineum]|uniref:Uncharacterized protein n=1 Tax=Fusarium albosuccineum TaxID=1237068 RepID=A0A8H4KX27_9HYPO|nr:hypothetical protein FALBO_14380 [Fusarium albosuccineum]